MATDSKEKQSDDDGEGDGAKGPQEQQPPPTWLSWSIRGLSLLIILALIGYFAYQAAQPMGKPDITFEEKSDKIEQRGTDWAVPVKVKNEGDMSVHALKVSATLGRGEDAPSKSADVLLLGSREAVTVTFWFEEDPRGKAIDYTVGSYLLP